MRDLIVFCHLRWDFVLQRPQHVISRLASQYRVTFVEEPVKTDGEERFEITRPAPNVQVLRPHTRADSSGFADDQLTTLSRLLSKHLASESITDYVVWFYTPIALPLLKVLKPRAVVYDCMDELSAFKNAPEALVARENELLRVADVVFTGGPSLYEAKRKRHPNVLCLPSAVDADHYAPERAMSNKASIQRAEELQGGIPTPRIGFFGVIDERLDIELIDRLASADPTWQIVMVGPVVKISEESLPRRQNIHWLGQQSYSILPQLVAGWDVCILPFALNESTRFVSPTKTLEYLAAEKPVVSTAVRDVAVLYGGHVHVADGAEEFVKACRNALAETSQARLTRIARSSQIVRSCSWDITAAAMRVAIKNILAKPKTAALQAA